MSEDDINRLLESRTPEGSMLYFSEIEKISDGIIMDLKRKYDEGMDWNSLYRIKITNFKVSIGRTMIYLSI